MTKNYILFIGCISAAIYIEEKLTHGCQKEVHTWLNEINRTNIIVHYVLAKGVSKTVDNIKTWLNS